MVNLYREHPSLTARFLDGTIEPDPAASNADTTVWLALPPEAAGTQVWEGLRAGTLDATTVRLAAVPLFAYNVHFGDEMSVINSAEGPLVATGIVRRGRFRTFRAWLGENQAANLPELIRRFGAMSCMIEGYSDSLMGIGCSIDQAPHVAESLTSAERNDELIWESGQQ